MVNVKPPAVRETQSTEKPEAALDDVWRVSTAPADAILPAVLTEIEAVALGEDLALEIVQVGSHVRKIGYGTFLNCSNMRSIELLLRGIGDCR